MFTALLLIFYPLNNYAYEFAHGTGGTRVLVVAILFVTVQYSSTRNILFKSRPTVHVYAILTHCQVTIDTLCTNNYIFWANLRSTMRMAITSCNWCLMLILTIEHLSIMT